MSLEGGFGEVSSCQVQAEESLEKLLIIIII